MYHVLAVSVLLRLVLLSQDSSSWLSDRVELSTPLNSWTRCKTITREANYCNSIVKEGVALKGAGISPYQSDLFHEVMRDY